MKKSPIRIVIVAIVLVFITIKWWTCSPVSHRSGPYTVTRSQLLAIAHGVGVYYDINGRMPTGRLDLESTNGVPTYTNPEWWRDVWGNEVILTSKEDGRFEVRSPGPKRAFQRKPKFAPLLLVRARIKEDGQLVVDPVRAGLAAAHRNEK